MSKFELKLGKAFYTQGFFNVPVDVDGDVGPDGAQITLELDGGQSELTAKVNRTAQPNGTARIMGGVPLKKWFQEHLALGDILLVEILSHTRMAIQGPGYADAPRHSVREVQPVRKAPPADPSKPSEHIHTNVNGQVAPDRVDAVRHILATLYAAQNALRSLAPEYRWSGLGNLLGDYGEFIAIEKYGLRKAAGGSGSYDAVGPNGKTVQIKANHSASQIGYRGEADLLLVLHIEDNGDWKEVYYGDFHRAKAKSRYSQRDNKYMIPISTLRTLSKNQKEA